MHLVSSISHNREEKLLNYWPPVPSVYPQMTRIKIVWFQKISIPPRHGRSLEIPRGRGVQRQKFPRGVGVHRKLIFQKGYRMVYPK